MLQENAGINNFLTFSKSKIVHSHNTFLHNNFIIQTYSKTHKQLIQAQNAMFLFHRNKKNFG